MTVRRWGRPRGGLPFETAERRLAEDFLLALGTDGLLQAPDPDADAGPDLLPRTVAGPARPLEQLCGAVPTTLLSGPRSGDAALLIARPRPPQAGRAVRGSCSCRRSFRSTGPGDVRAGAIGLVCPSYRTRGAPFEG
ncbi:hypothetical protein GCM10010207_51340 [Streptomyces atratus]|uniref:SpoIIE family protein phosphatase n=1 Tax=Streptomyces atratus TaxID=1893 RepID=UPI001670AFBF|nr:hypothetical protein GCM10010207_51340 [Streptomyces atratus]